MKLYAGIISSHTERCNFEQILQAEGNVHVKKRLLLYPLP